MKYLVVFLLFLQIATSYALVRENKRANEAEEWIDVVSYQVEEMMQEMSAVKFNGEE